MESLNYKLTTTDEFMNKIPDVLKWLSGYNLNISSSRFSRYEEYIQNYFSKDNIDEKNEMQMLKILEERFIKLDCSFQECSEIVEIYNAFKLEKSKGFRDRLTKVIQGSDFRHECSSNDVSRDFQYELLIASRFAEWGYKINFDEETDVIASKNSDIVYIECKRIKSISALERNYKKAGKQLKARKPQTAYGIVFIDIHDCLSDKVRTYEYSNPMELYTTMNNAIKSFVKTNEYKLVEVNDRFVENALGVCLTANKMMWLSGFSPQYFKKHQVLASEYLSDELYEKFKEIYNRN